MIFYEITDCDFKVQSQKSTGKDNFIAARLTLFRMEVQKAHPE